MSFKFTFREITPEDTEILRILKLRNAKPEEHICCEILRGDGITMKTWYSKADVALWGEDYIKANSKMKYIDGDWTVSLDVEPWKRTHGVSSKKVTSPSSPRYPTWLTGHVKEWAEKRLPILKRQGSVRFRLIAIIALVVHTKGSIVQKSMDGMQHSLLQRMLQTGQRAKGICKVKNSAIMQSLGMA